MSSPVLTNNLSTKILCTSAASVVKLQCGREYGFGDDKARATDLSLLNDSDLEGLPTKNLIRNNMVLYKSKKEIKLDKLSKKLLIILSNHETNWNTLQQEKLKKKKLEEKLKKSSKAKDYTKKLLQNCKSWGCPCTTVEEFQQILKKKCNQDVLKLSRLTMLTLINPTS